MHHALQMSISRRDLQRNAFCKKFVNRKITCAYFESFARQTKERVVDLPWQISPQTGSPALRPENIHDCLRWNGSHAQASLEFRPSLVTRRHWWYSVEGNPRERRARFSLPHTWRHRASRSVQSVHFREQPTQPAWFRLTPEYRARRSLPATDKRRPHFYSTTSTLLGDV